MKQALLIIILISLIFLTGCSNGKNNLTDNAIIINQTNVSSSLIIEEISICNFPYIEYKKGDCCLDNNSNKICDKDEQPQIKETVNNSKNATKEIADVDKVFNYLKDKGILVTEVSFWFNPSAGNICRTFLDAPGSDPDFDQIRLSFIEMYKMWENEPDEYCVIIDNSKNKNQYRSHETCYYCGKKIAVRDAYQVDRWDDIKGYCQTI